MSFGTSVSDFVAVPVLAWQVYTACRDSSSDFAGLSNEVLLMHAALDDVGEYVKRHGLGAERVARLALIGKGCNDVLKALEVILAGYESLGSKSKGLKERCKRMRDRLRWAMETVGDFRMRLVSHTNMLTLFLASITISSQVLTEGDIAQVLKHVAHLTLAQSNHVITALDQPEIPRSKTQPLGVAMPCWSCKVLRKPCAPGKPCPSCIADQSRLRFLPCRRGPLKHLTTGLIPSKVYSHAEAWSLRSKGFFRPWHDAHRRLLFTGANDFSSIYGALKRVYCPLRRVIDVEMLICDTWDDFDTAIALQTPVVMERLQHSCPEQHPFQQRLLGIAIRLQQREGQTAAVIAMATKFLLLSLLASSLLPDIDMLSSGQEVFSRDTKTSLCFWRVRDREFHLASLECSLQAVLTELEALLVRRDRCEWSAACTALCLIFFAAENMQLDIHLKHTGSAGRSMCEAMKKSSILPLAELFSVSTAGFRPLDLDWKVEQNSALVDNNHQVIESLQSLQTLSQEYSTFLDQRRLTEDLVPGIDRMTSFTGKSVAEILR